MHVRIQQLMINYFIEETSTEDIWTPYKELQNLVVRSITLAPSMHDPQYHEFIEALRNHRQNFFTLLKNPVSILLYISLFTLLFI